MPLPPLVSAKFLARYWDMSYSTALRKMKSGIWGPWQKRPGLGISVTKEDFIAGVERECQKLNELYPPTPHQIRYWEARRRREAKGWKLPPNKKEVARQEAWEREQGPPL